MKKLRILSTALAMAALLTTQALAVPAAELVRVFAAGDALYTYVSITGAEAPITKAEAKLGQRSFPASGPLETVRQAGFPVEYLLLVDNQLFGTEKDLHTALDKLAQASKERAGEFISIFYGEGVDPDQAEQALALFQTACPDAEITMLEGGQPVYHYLISVE